MTNDPPTRVNPAQTSNEVDLDRPDQRFEARLGQQQSTQHMQAKIVDQELSNLGNALDRVVREGTVLRAASLLVTSRRRYILGEAKSFGYATLLAKDLAVGLSHVTLIDNSTNNALDILPEVRRTDVLVAFSFRRYRRSTVSLARQFVAAGGHLVTITDRDDSPLSDVSTASVFVPTDSASYADSPTAVVSVTHLLTTLATASAKGARRRMAERQTYSTALKLYIRDP